MSDALINSLAAAVEARPDDLPLRLHLAELLVTAGRGPEAIGHVAQILAREPGNAAAQQLMTRALGGGTVAGSAPGVPPKGSPEEQAAESAAATPAAGEAADRSGIDWAAMEEQFGDVVPPRFARADGEPDPVRGHADRAFDVERSTVTLADVGGMTDVKKRLEVSFLGPLRNPKLRSLFGKSLRGGLLLYGPPGCGKTFLARAVAGEMGAAFISLSITDVLNMWIGSSERNLHDLFESARGHAPCVLFLDEIDALGHKRSQLQSSMRTVVNQLLTELDGVDGGNDGVFVLAATNAPWDVDAALRRPGRLDRTVLVLPPDAPARAAILEYHLRDRPVAGIDLGAVAAATEHYSGADLAHLCETAAEYAMRDSIDTGEIRMIGQADMLAAAREVRPSTDAWFATARNVAMFANESGAYDDLAAYLKKRKIR
ncbi:cell division control protein 48 CDC48 [Actinoplanes philippinensis]|uniref:Tetratricopeptide repeat-containing protein n=1 Tax=Actinoplanes philippinensis TaxID=35752 RepID=A0A1I2GSJ6_9ACTN|nr:AAA family ATPase [Actinoplanes philippinensis]GIE78040.1 cell division control protein 48 CDC48 [Actinoplanes philippinensis]SFF20208.1 Tetratricopeptide repeat-containing protein [Actinoplanes philippinensis]